MSEEQSEFLRELYSILKKVKAYHLNTVRVVTICAGIVVTFGGIMIVQGFATSREAASVTKQMEMVSRAQTLMYEVMNGRMNDLDVKVEQAKQYTREQRAELQRQLDFIMKDRKLVDRGASPNNNKSKPIPQPK
jgi:hypothetical protein